MDFIAMFAAATGILGAVLLAMNVGLSRYGFCLFLLSSICWSSVALSTAQPALLANQLVFVAINLLGIWRWFVQPSVSKVQRTTR